MNHRVFTAFNLPEEIKNKLSEYQKKWPELPVRWTKRENLHITLEFLGYVSEQKLEEVIKRIGRIRTWEWRRIEPEQRPVVNEEINLKFEVNSIEVMESHLKRRGAEYVVLKSVPLGK